MLGDSTQRRFQCRKVHNVDGTVKLEGRDQALRTSTVNQDQPAQGEEHNGVIQREADGSQPSDQRTDDNEARDDFWSTSGNYFCRHHVQPRVKLYLPNEGPFPTTKID